MTSAWYGHHMAYLQVLGSTNIALNWLSLPPVCTWQSMQTVVRQPAEADGLVRVRGTTALPVAQRVGSRYAVLCHVAGTLQTP